MEVRILTDSFPRILRRLRKERKLNQRVAAAGLSISQALLSHYENGSREPGLSFVDTACRYYDVSADYLLGRSSIRASFAEDSPSQKLTEMTENGVLALLSLRTALRGAADAQVQDAKTLLALSLSQLFQPFEPEDHMKANSAEAVLTDTAIHLLQIRLSAGNNPPEAALPDALRLDAQGFIDRLQARLTEADSQN